MRILRYYFQVRYSYPRISFVVGYDILGCYSIDMLYHAHVWFVY